jgi:Predicted S-adenosylmethionine-dependent methyltransferase involved in bacterial cell division
MNDNLSEILSEASDFIGIMLGEKEIALFQEYYRLLLFWNNKINLVSIKSDIDVPVKHFIDSLTPLQFIENKESSIIDIGTGAGFPGIPMKIAANRLKLSLLDSSRKRFLFSSSLFVNFSLLIRQLLTEGLS